MRRPSLTLRFAALASLAALALVACGGAQTGAVKGRSAASPLPAAETASPSQSQAVTFKDGTYQVGKDIQAGTYRTRSQASLCYWKRLSGFGGTLDETISSVMAAGYAVVTIAPSDKGFTSSGCGTWSSDLSAVITGSAFGDGTYIVGTDVQPGTYRNDRVDVLCYYKRLSGFGGTSRESIAIEVTLVPAIVEIGAGDKGFSTSGCGTWSSAG